MSDAPPTDPREIEIPAEPPRWPRVVGIISIVWGSLGIACNGCGVLGAATQSMFTKGAEDEFGPMPDVMKAGPVAIAVMLLATIIAVLLIFSGSMLLGRRPISRPLHLTYAAISIISAVAGAAVGISNILAQTAWARQNPDNKWAQFSNPAIGAAMMGLGILLGLAWPVFCLIWFGFIKKTAASMGHNPVDDV
ncbi:MAG: hypothetical protein ACKVW3_13500 [Phycisphaerales bacterium]